MFLSEPINVFQLMKEWHFQQAVLLSDQEVTGVSNASLYETVVYGIA